MISNKPAKGDILIYIDSVRQKAINPNDLFIVVGTVVTGTNEDGTTYKKIGSGTPKKLGVVLSENQNEIDNLNRELNELKISYRKNMKTLVSIIEVLTNQTELNNMNINDLKSIKEDIKDEE